MSTIKQIGIWMDHSSARLLEFSDSTKKELKTITSDFTFQDKEETLQRSESEMHNKERQRHNSYYKKIEAVIRNCDEVLLFGPTDAKVELFNLLRKNHHFDPIKIEVKTTDKMTDNQLHAFVKEHFTGLTLKLL